MVGTGIAGLTGIGCHVADQRRAARTDAERARADAVRALNAAEHASRAKSEFLAVMSHELRTPLNAIGGYAELMELGVHGPISPQQRDALDRIQRSQRMLLGLINGVLNYTRIETGNVQYHIAKVRVMELLRVTEALISPQMGAKGLRYECGSCASTVSCRADGDKVQQILLNLLSNAVKFTQRGGTVRIEPKATTASVVIRVRDTGIGIAQDKLEQIFEPFVQIDANYTRTRDGVGLGLAISRDLARGMGGELTVESALGKGSTFTLKLARS
jgi:signal transduction histidine kinase